MSKFAIVALAVATAAPVVAKGEVRVAHLSPDTPAVNVNFGPAGGPLAEIISGLTYPNLAPAQGSTGAYLPVPTGSYDIRVDAPSLGAAGTGAIAVNGLALDGNTSYTVAAVGTLGSLLSPDPATSPLQPLLLVDDRAVAPGLAKIRFVHASANTPAVDIVLDADGTEQPGDPVLFPNVARFTSGGYITVPAGTYQLDAFLNDRSILSTPALDDLSLTVDANTVYTVWAVGLNGLVGQLPANPSQALTVAVTIDAVPEPATLGLLASAGLLALRRRR